VSSSYPTIVAGMTLTSAILQALGARLSAVKGTDQSLSSSTTLQNDSALALPLAGGGVYLIICWLYITGTTAKAAFTWSGTAAWSPTGGGNVATASGTASTTTLAAGGWLLIGLITAASGGDTLQLQWAQSSSSGTATVVKASSVLAALRLS
jgi:hypothetical protein